MDFPVSSLQARYGLHHTVGCILLSSSDQINGTAWVEHGAMLQRPRLEAVVQQADDHQRRPVVGPGGNRLELRQNVMGFMDNPMKIEAMLV